MTDSQSIQIDKKILQKRKLLKETIALYRNHGKREILANIGAYLIDISKNREAEKLLSKIYQEDNNYLPVFSNYALALFLNGNFKLSEEMYRKLDDSGKLDAAQCNNFGNLLRDLGRLEESLSTYERGLTLEPNHSKLLANIGILYRKFGRIKECIYHLSKALEVDPHDRSCRLELANIYVDLRRYKEAEEHFSILRKSPFGRHHAIFNTGLMLLSYGDYKQGFSAYEHRWQAHKDILKAPPFADRIAKWEGQSLEGRSILVCSEQGYGDSIQFVRYLPLLKERYPDSPIYVYCHLSLEKLFESLLKPLKIKFVDHSKTVIPKTHFYCSMVSLPFFLGVKSSATSCRMPYLAPHAESYQWLKEIGLFTKRKFRVGLCLKGNPKLKRDSFRSISENHFNEYFKELTNQFEWIDLQKDYPLEGDHLRQPLKNAKTFSDSAAVISSCDVILTVDTVIAHIAGSLGKTTFMLNRYDSDWRWKIGNPNSVWYPTVYVISQRKPGEWNWPLLRAKELVSTFSQINAVPMLDYDQLP